MQDYQMVVKWPTGGSNTALVKEAEKRIKSLAALPIRPEQHDSDQRVR